MGINFGVYTSLESDKQGIVWLSLYQQSLRFFATSTDHSINLCEPQLWKWPNIPLYTFILVPWWLKGKLPLKWRAHCLLIKGKSEAVECPQLPRQVGLNDMYFAYYNNIVGFQGQDTHNTTQPEGNVLLNSGETGVPGMI